MLEETPAHLRLVLEDAQRQLSLYFTKPITFSKAIQLSEPDRRNVLLRLFLADPQRGMPATIILKQNAVDVGKFDIAKSETEIEQMSRFAHDWAGLKFLTEIGCVHAPRFYTASHEHKFILFEDLGLGHPSLVGPLTRSANEVNVEEAKSALLAYVKCVGKMHADTFGNVQKFSSILHQIYPHALRYHSLLKEEIVLLNKQLKQVIGHESKELIKELESVHEFSQTPGEFHVFLHGDICPDNVYYQGSTLKLIDFEFADFGNALIDGVYLRMNMPSCWCSKAVPEPILSQMESLYREELKKAIVQAGDDTLYNKQVTYACAYWLLKTISDLDVEHEWILPSGPVDDDSMWAPKENSFRPKILARLSAFISLSKKTKHLPKLCEVAQDLLTHLKKIWPQAHGSDLFPVFKKSL